MGLGQFGSYGEKINLHPFFTSHTKADSSWKEAVNIKNKATEIVKENMR